MSSELLKAYTAVPTHAVGNINSWKIRTLANGAVVDTADVDNFTLVELGFNGDGERICKSLSAVTKKGYLVATPERRYIEGESMAGFYNAVGDRARIVILDEGVRFDTSAYELNVVGNGGTAVNAVAKGMTAFFDPTEKKFIICNAGNEATLYATAVDHFVVVDYEEDECYQIDGVDTVRLEKQA